eukprot:TRINITY_DN646_c0_g1_i1.p1 TRINITY_DN646_c0_g1~~TRINITY_DN646_c0_g1_i1.p1  ORF type:complete len:379 (+),score=110.84 TRINITY_DN646_c0_g1_i1:103-1239(+)
MNWVSQRDSNAWFMTEIQKRDQIISKQNAQISELLKEMSVYKRLADKAFQESALTPNTNLKAVPTTVTIAVPDTSDTIPNVNFGKRYWSSAEHALFLEGLNKYGKSNWKLIAEHVKTRTADQVRTHAQKYFLSLKKDTKREDESTAVVPTIKSGEGRRRKKAKTSHACENTQYMITPPPPALSIENAKFELMPEKCELDLSHDLSHPGDDVHSMPIEPAGHPRKDRTPSPTPSILTLARNPQKEQLANATWELVISKIPDWTISEHCTFVDGLFAYQNEADLEERARLIWKTMLPMRSFECIQLCMELMKSFANLRNEPARSPVPVAPAAPIMRIPPPPAYMMFQPQSPSFVGNSFFASCSSQDELFRSLNTQASLAV